MSLSGLWPSLQCITSKHLVSQPLPVTKGVPQGSSLLAFSTFNLVLNTSKTKVMWFGKKNAPLPTGVITTSEGLELEVVTSYKYLARRYTVLLSPHIKSAG